MPVGVNGPTLPSGEITVAVRVTRFRSWTRLEACSETEVESLPTATVWAPLVEPVTAAPAAGW